MTASDGMVCVLSVLFILLHVVRKALAAPVLLLQLYPRRGFSHSRAPLPPPPLYSGGMVWRDNGGHLSNPTTIQYEL